MATVDRPRSKKHVVQPRPETPRRKSRAFRYGCLIMLLLLCGAVYLAPLVASYAPLAQWGLKRALQLDGTASLDRLSLGWFSPVRVERLVLRDADGQTVVELDSLDTEKSLIALVLDAGDIGLVRIERPRVHLVAFDTDTNLERMLARFLAAEGESTVNVRLQASEGTITLDDRIEGRKFQIDDLALNCAFAGVDQPLTLALSGALPAERHPASFKVDLQTEVGEAGGSALANGRVDCQTEAVPLELAQPALRRAVKQASLSGLLSTRLGGAWGKLAEGGAASVSGQSQISQLRFAAAALGNDAIELDSVQIPCQIVQQGDNLEIRQLGLDCELGQLNLTGSAKLSDLSAADRMARLIRDNFDLTGKLDLAQLARRLPETLQIRPGTQITSGDVELALASRPQADGATWSGTLESKRLGATADGRPVQWNNPLSVSFAARETKTHLAIERARCTSSFLEVDARGSIDDLTASARFDLARLAQELRQFSDLGGLQLAGSGQGQLVWKRQEAEKFDAQGSFHAQGFQLATADGRAWRESQVKATLVLAGTLQDHAVKGIDRGELKIEAGGDQFAARLPQAISDVHSGTWPLRCTWRGSLSAWPARLESCAGISGWDLGGSGTLEAQANVGRQTIELQSAKADFAQLRAVGHGLFVSEPAVTLALAGRADLAKGRFEATTLDLAAGATTARLQQMVVQNDNSGLALDSGTAQIAADLAQVFRWQHDPRLAQARQVTGRLQGTAQFKQAASATDAQLEATIDQLQVIETPARPGATAATWREPRISLAAQGSYQRTANTLKLDKLQVASAALRCEAQGLVPLASDGGPIELTGNVAYDWQQLAPVWRPYLGNQVQIAGRQSRAFAVSGRLTGPLTDGQAWKHVVGEGALGWEAIDVYGLRVGPGEFAARLADGELRGKPMDVAVSEGRFTFTPFARLSPAPAEALLPKGPLLTNVRLTPEMCARGLKFITPILAESTVAEGHFSMELDGGRVPLDDPAAGDISGRMAMLGQAKAGPIGQEFMILINEISSVLQRGQLVRRNDQAAALVRVDAPNAEFRLVNRRVYHRNFKFVVGTLPITTHGSVGLDETLALVAEVPIQAKLLGRDLSLGALEGQTLQIPIEGTLNRPRLDHRIVQNLAGQLIENAARGALIDGLNRLLPPQPRPGGP